MAQQFKDMKVRLDPDKADAIKLWLDSGTARVSFTTAMGLLMEALHDRMFGECTLEVLAVCLQDAVEDGQSRIEQRRAGR